MLAYLIRRAGVDDYHPDKPAEEYSVDEIGRTQSRLLADHLCRTGVPPDSIYTAATPRHRETAALIADTIAMIRGDRPDVEEVDGLRDAAWTTDALQTCYEEALGQQEWSRRMARGELPFEETVTEVRERVGDARERIVERADSNAVGLVVTSAIPVQLLVHQILGLELAETTLPVNNTGLFEVHWGEEGDSVVQLNATPHLAGGLLTRDYFVRSQ